MNNRDVSLDSFVGDDGDTSHMEFLTYDGEDQEVSLIKKEEMGLVQRNIVGALSKLNEKEVYIIEHRIMADEPKTLQEIGDRYQISRERARQIEKQALRKLQLALPHLDGERKLLEAGTSNDQ